MQHFRRTLLTILVLVTVAASLVGFPGASNALPTRGVREPMAPGITPQQEVIDPHTGEPDTGGSRSKLVSSTENRLDPAVQARITIPALRMLRWTSLMWVKRVLGMGE